MADQNRTAAVPRDQFCEIMRQAERQQEWEQFRDHELKQYLAELAKREQPVEAARRGGQDMSSGDQNQAAARWKWHAPDFASLMLGRIELAQITKGRASDNWFWTLRFTQDDERPAFSAPTELAAKQVCEVHAIKVLS